MFLMETDKGGFLMQATGFFEKEKERKRSIITHTHTPHKKKFPFAMYGDCHQDSTLIKRQRISNHEVSNPG